MPSKDEILGLRFRDSRAVLEVLIKFERRL